MNQTSWAHRARAGAVRFWLAVALGLALLPLAACGGSTAGSGGPGAPTPIPTRPGGGLTIRPCLGTYDSTVTPDVTLDSSSSTKSANATTGDLVAFRMDGQHKWTLSGVSPAAALSAEGSQGMFDSSADQCVWLFHATGSGDVTVRFTGVALCDPTQACPQYAILATFTVHIS